MHYLSFALTSCSKSVSVGFFQTLLSSNVVRNLCISARTYFGSAAQTRLFFLMTACNSWQMFNDWQFQGLVFLFPPPPPRPYIHDCLGVVPQTRQAESGLQASHRPGETLQHGRGSPVAQAATLHLIELAALREHLEGVLEETVEVWIRILPARRWALSVRPPSRDMTRNFFKQGRGDSAEEGQRNCNMSGVHLHVRCNDPCRKPELRAASS